jgi:hypothetical protein
MTSPARPAISREGFGAAGDAFRQMTESRPDGRYVPRVDFSIVDVSDWVVKLPEPGGSDANTWLIDPVTNEAALFKPVVAKAGRRQGEDWAEKAVEQVAALIGVPTARIRMATRRSRSGLLSYDLADGSELHTGAVLIGEIDTRLVARAKERLGHNLDNIHRVLASLPAVGMGAGAFTAFDQFCGYLVLDALVANRDRHEENWGVLRDPGDRVTLAPSFDHGNSLGFNLPDENKLRELDQDPQLVKWANKGYADRFEGGRNVTLVDFAHTALGRATPGTEEHWLGRLATVGVDKWQGVVEHTAEMSEPCRTFCLRLLTTNQRRLLRDVSSGSA